MTAPPTACPLPPSPGSRPPRRRRTASEAAAARRGWTATSRACSRTTTRSGSGRSTPPSSGRRCTRPSSGGRQKKVLNYITNVCFRCIFKGKHIYVCMQFSSYCWNLQNQADSYSPPMFMINMRRMVCVCVKNSGGNPIRIQLCPPPFSRCRARSQSGAVVSGIVTVKAGEEKGRNKNAKVSLSDSFWSESLFFQH